MIGASYSTGSIAGTLGEKERPFDFIKAGGYWASQLAGIRRSAHMGSLTVHQQGKFDRYGNRILSTRTMTQPTEAEVARLWAAVRAAGTRQAVLDCAVASSETLKKALEGRRVGVEALGRLLAAAEKILERAGAGGAADAGA